MLVHMDVELLVVPSCPNERPAHELTLRVLEELHLTAFVVTTIVETEQQAQERGFIGSPTILINGRDPFPQPDAPVGIACRVYRTRDGMAGHPSTEALREAFQRAAE